MQTEPIILIMVYGLHWLQRQVERHFYVKAPIVALLFQMLLALRALICVTKSSSIRIDKIGRAALLLGY